jgi:SAM-dependent methyltransferase
VRDSFRRLDPAAYPELVGLSRNDAYGHGDTMAPGGLCLAAIMSRSLDPEPGQLVLDIGCGRGDSSIYLAEQCGAQVACFDLWVGASWLGRKMKRRARDREVLPMASMRGSPCRSRMTTSARCSACSPSTPSGRPPACCGAFSII